MRILEQNTYFQLKHYIVKHNTTCTLTLCLVCVWYCILHGLVVKTFSYYINYTIHPTEHINVNSVHTWKSLSKWTVLLLFSVKFIWNFQWMIHSPLKCWVEQIVLRVWIELQKASAMHKSQLLNLIVWKSYYHYSHLFLVENIHRQV